MLRKIRKIPSKQYTFSFYSCGFREQIKLIYDDKSQKAMASQGGSTDWKGAWGNFPGYGNIPCLSGGYMMASHRTLDICVLYCE